MAKVTDISVKMDKFQKLKSKMPRAPDWVQEGYEAMKKLSDREQLAIVQYIFGLILSDVETGLKGEDAEIFFTKIDELYEAVEAQSQENTKTCFFCDQAVDAGVCLGCLMKLAKGDDIRGKGIIKGLIDEVQGKRQTSLPGKDHS